MTAQLPAPPLTVWTGMARKILLTRKAVPYRLWLIAKALDYGAGGSGEVSLNALLVHSEAYRLNSRHVRRALAFGTPTFWTWNRYRDAYALCGYKRLIRLLGGKKPGRIVGIPAAVVGQIGAFKAYLYAACVGEAQVSRASLSQQFDHSLPTLRRWEETAHVERHRCIVQIRLNSLTDLRAYEWETVDGWSIADAFSRYFWYECRRCNWRRPSHDPTGNELAPSAFSHERLHPDAVTVLTQLPNYYRSPLSEIWIEGTGRGKLKQMRQARHAPTRGVPQAGRSTDRTARGTSKRQLGGKGRRRTLQWASGMLEAISKAERTALPVLAFRGRAGGEGERLYEVVIPGKS